MQFSGIYTSKINARARSNDITVKHHNSTTYGDKYLYGTNCCKYLK